MSAGFTGGSSSLTTPPNRHGWRFRLVHRRPRPRRGHHRRQQTRLIGLSPMSDFESMNLVIYVTLAIAAVLIATLWWRLLG